MLNKHFKTESDNLMYLIVSTSSIYKHVDNFKLSQSKSVLIHVAMIKIKFENTKIMLSDQIK